ncbi:MAG: rhomboid family intramembrane serine protease [Candidatus Hydrogenedentes bacterium]|nr:rhomboid family intramembrane serine protease [Candidatus Hydrogenedentota bacterium]
MSNYSSYERPSAFGAPRITWGVQRLLFLNAAVFAIQLLWDPLELILAGVGYWPFRLGALESAPPGGILTFWFGFQPDLFLRGLLFKPFTYQFLHTGLMHLFVNMLWLFFFGPDVERALGTRSFLRFYILCGAVAVLLTIPEFLVSRDGPISVIGASGAVMAVMVAFAVIDPERQLILFPIPAPINARALILIIIVFNLIGLLQNSSNSVATHFGGMIAGYLYMKGLPRMTAWRQTKRKQRLSRKKGGGDSKMGEAVDNIFKFKDHDRR